MDQEDALREAIRAKPEDTDCRLLLGYWLDEKDRFGGDLIRILVGSNPAQNYRDVLGWFQDTLGWTVGEGYSLYESFCEMLYSVNAYSDRRRLFISATGGHVLALAGKRLPAGSGALRTLEAVTGDRPFDILVVQHAIERVLHLLFPPDHDDTLRQLHRAWYELINVMAWAWLELPPLRWPASRTAPPAEIRAPETVVKVDEAAVDAAPRFRRRLVVPRTPEIWRIEHRAAARFRMRGIGWPCILAPLLLPAIAFGLMVTFKIFGTSHLGYLAVLLAAGVICLFTTTDSLGDYWVALRVLLQDLGIMGVWEPRKPDVQTYELDISQFGIVVFINGEERRRFQWSDFRIIWKFSDCWMLIFLDSKRYLPLPTMLLDESCDQFILSALRKSGVKTQINPGFGLGLRLWN
jgi:uncharacterized protein (TIGR02996 family)